MHSLTKVSQLYCQTVFTPHKINGTFSDSWTTHSMFTIYTTFRLVAGRFATLFWQFHWKPGEHLSLSVKGRQIFGRGALPSSADLDPGITCPTAVTTNAIDKRSEAGFVIDLQNFYDAAKFFSIDWNIAVHKHIHIHLSRLSSSNHGRS